MSAALGYKEKNPVTANLKGVTVKKAICPNLFKAMKLKGLRLKHRNSMVLLYLECPVCFAAGEFILTSEL